MPQFIQSLLDIDLAIDVSYKAGVLEKIVLSTANFKARKQESLEVDISVMTKWLDCFFDTNNKLFQDKHAQLNQIISLNALSLVGTDYQLKVWQMLYTIPFGEVRTYSEIADELQSHPRAVGGACRMNPLPLIIPCHRVVAKNHVGGFMGHQSDSPYAGIKKALLAFERSCR